MQKIKVAFLVNDLLIGGAQRIIFDIATLIDKNKFETEVLYIKDFDERGKTTFKSLFQKHNIKTVYLGEKSKFKTFLNIFKYLKNSKPKVLHTFLPDSVILGSFAARFSGVNKIIIHEMNSHGFFTKKLHYFYEAARMISTLSIFYSDSLEFETLGKKNSLAKPIEKLTFKSCSILDGINLKEIDEHRNEAFRAQKRQELGVLEGEVMILSVARLIDWKGQRFLVDAFKSIGTKYGNVKLFIAGDGPDMELLINKRNEIIDENLKNRIHLLGSRPDAYELMNACDIFSLAINYPKGFESISLGMSSMEAMAMGKATIGSRYEDIYEGINDGEEILLVNPGDVQDLERKLEKYILDLNLRKMIGENARKYVGENFSAEKIVKIFESIYTNI